MSLPHSELDTPLSQLDLPSPKLISSSPTSDTVRPSRLLNLPAELRDQIIDYALESKVVVCERWPREKSVSHYYCGELPPPPWAALKATNKQLCVETEERLRCKKRVLHLIFGDLECSYSHVLHNPKILQFVKSITFEVCWDRKMWKAEEKGAEWVMEDCRKTIRGRMMSELEEAGLDPRSPVIIDGLHWCDGGGYVRRDDPWLLVKGTIIMRQKQG
jgi:hypothetical protein